MATRTDDSRNYFDPRQLSELRGLKLRARRIMEGLVAGLHRSPFHGFSVEFAEHREYAPGDDVRHIDWRVFGRTDRFYVRRFEQETNFDCCLLVDCSESMQFRSDLAALTKFEYGQLLATALAWLIIRQRDRAAVALFDDEIREHVAASAAPAHLHRLIAVMSDAKQDRPSAIGNAIHQLANRLNRRSVVIVISDLFEPLDSVDGALKHLRHRGHDASLVQVIDPAEQDFPYDHPTRFCGLESMNDHAIDPRALAKAYRHEFEAFQRSMGAAARRLGIDHTLIRSDTSLDHAVTKALTARRALAGSG